MGHQQARWPAPTYCLDMSKAERLFELKAKTAFEGDYGGPSSGTNGCAIEDWRDNKL